MTVQEDLPEWAQCSETQKQQWVERIVKEVLMPLWSSCRAGNLSNQPRRMVADMDILVDLRSRLMEYEVGEEEFDQWKRQVLEVVEWAPAQEGAPWFYVQTEQDIQRESLLRQIQRWAAEVGLVEYLQARGIPPAQFNDAQLLLSLRLAYMAVDLYHWNQTRQRLVIAPAGGLGQPQ